MLRNFRFLDGFPLAGSAHPGSGKELRENLAELVEKHRVGAVVTLCEEPLPRETLAEYGLRFFHLPTRDFGVPTLAQTRQAVDFVRRQSSRGVRTLVHCGAGIGRTGVFLACCLVADGMAPQAALAKIRRDRPGSVETPEQERFVEQWAEYIGKRDGKN